MDLRTYLAGAERGAAASLARALGVRPVMVSQWSAGLKQVPIERCTGIEVATSGAVTRRELRPTDWRRIWPELDLVTEASDAA